MIKIDYPEHDFRVKRENGREMIFDEIRKTWLKLTPEEWVRQNFVRYLIAARDYPSALVALEKRISLGELSKRFDVWVRRSGLPRITFHGLRHTWATMAMEKGIHTKVVSDRLGHANISVTLDIYSKVRPAMDAQAAELVAAELFAGAIGDSPS